VVAQKNTNTQYEANQRDDERIRPNAHRNNCMKEERKERNKLYE
jgi:hypothetical protein